MSKRNLHYLSILLPYLVGSALYAQNNTLESCLVEYIKARKALDQTRPANQTMFLLFDSTAQKYSKIHQDWRECVKGHHIPVLSFRTLSGESYDSSALAGKILVINFWFMSCVPCRAEMPALNRLVEEYKGKNVLFLGFATDPADRLKTNFVSKSLFDFTIIADASRIANSFHFFGYPSTYVVDGKGIIRKAWLGGVDKSPLDPYYRAKEAIDDLLTITNK